VAQLNSPPRYFNRRRPSLAQVLRTRKRERWQTLRSAATYGNLEMWPGAPLTVVVSIYQPGVMLVILSGEAVDLASPLIGRAIAGQLSGKPRRLIFDLRHVDLLAPSAVGELVTAQLYGETHDFDVALVAPSDAALHALTASGNTERFAVHSTIEGALPA
jgi:hypothetical protein